MSAALLQDQLQAGAQVDPRGSGVPRRELRLVISRAMVPAESASYSAHFPGTTASEQAATHTSANVRPQVQLYDIAKDPMESENVYLQHPDVVARLTALPDRYKRQGYSRAIR